MIYNFYLYNSIFFIYLQLNIYLFMNYLSYQLGFNNTFFNQPVFTQNPLIQYIYPQTYCMPYNSIPFYSYITSQPSTQEIQEVKEKKQNIKIRVQDEESIKKSEGLAQQNQSHGIKLCRTIQNKGKYVKNKKKKVGQQNSQEDQWYQQDQDQLSNYDQFKKSHSNRKKIYKQNPCRNILTNIGNQLITYICSNKKSKKQLNDIIPEAQEEYFKQFYLYSWNLKKQTDYYLNIKKIKQFWFQQSTQEDKRFKKNIRALSSYYLRWILPLSILTSKKMSPSSRLFHLKARKTLAKALKTKI